MLNDPTDPCDATRMQKDIQSAACRMQAALSWVNELEIVYLDALPVDMHKSFREQSQDAKRSIIDTTKGNTTVPPC